MRIRPPNLCRPVYLAAYQSINSTNGGAGLFAASLARRPARAHSPPGTRYSESRSGPTRSVGGKGVNPSLLSPSEALTSPLRVGPAAAVTAYSDRGRAEPLASHSG